MVAGLAQDRAEGNHVMRSMGLLKPPAERALLQRMAARAVGVWTKAELTPLAAAAQFELEPTLHLLNRHNVSIETADGVRFASELMRRWVVEFQPKEAA